MKISIYSIFTFVAMLSCADLSAQQAEGLMNKGDNLRNRYRFDESLTVYRQALEAAQQQEDSTMSRLIGDRILMSENGKSMTAFVYSPEVVSRQKFSVEDFYLYYPLPNRSWRRLPNQLDSSADHRFNKAMFVPEGSNTLYWSAEDEEGIRNLYTSTLQDTVWTVPSLINEQITSVSDEIYPLLSADGKHLYFSSEGLHGVGGYDLYVSDWDEDAQEWSAPENLGFPYSSPADDFMFYNTPDGKYTLFASNRECSEDSVWMYALIFDNMPIRKSMEDPSELERMMNLEIQDGPADFSADKANSSIPENLDTRKYMDKMSEVRSLRDSVSIYAAMIGSDVPDVGEKLNNLQSALTKAQNELQKIELDFLFKGVVIDPEKLMEEADKEEEEKVDSYSFSKNEMGGSLVMNILEPEVKFDYSFKVLEEGQFAEDQNIPAGVVYQIQIFASKNKASIKSLKGLSPVYETRNASGTYVYRVGIFRTYNDVLSHLNTVKKVGFKSAYIVPFIDGKVVKMAVAKAQETVKKADPVFYEVRVMPAGGSLDSAVSSGIRQQAGGKDIARVQNSDGTTVYVVGPFDSKAKADSLVEFVKAMGVSNVSSNKVK